MKIHEIDHRINLPGGTEISVRQLEPSDALHVQIVKDAAWVKTYVDSGLLSLADSREHLDPSNPDIVNKELARIENGRNALNEGDMRGPLLLGAFTVSGQMLVGVLRYDGKASRLGLRYDVNEDEGEVVEVDVKPRWMNGGVGRAMFYVALLHGQQVGHTLFGLDVVAKNRLALRFYERKLGIKVVGDSQPMRGWPRTMDRVFMGGRVDRSLNKLMNDNSWLAALPR